MKSRHTIFFISLFCVIVFAVVLTFALRHIVPHIVTPSWPILLSFFVVLNVLIYFMTIKVKNKNDINKMTHFHMIVTIVKLILCLAIITTYAIMCVEGARAFIISFLVYYLCFTLFETFVKIKINN